jgi:type II secretory pathway component PulM
MRAWFARFNQREQLSLLVLAAVVLLFLLHRTLWQPLAGMHERMALQNRGLAEVLQRVDGMVSQIATLQESGAGNRPQRNLTSLINQSTDRFGLPVLRLQPNSRGEIQVRMENVPFDKVVAWLHDVENREALVVREAALTQAGAAGLVNATVRLGQGE